MSYREEEIYYLENVIYHLCNAYLQDKAKVILLNLRFALKKIKLLGLDSLMKDFKFNIDDDIKFINRALAESYYIISEDYSQFMPQILLRIPLGLSNTLDIFLESIKDELKKDYSLIPLSHSLLNIEAFFKKTINIGESALALISKDNKKIYTIEAYNNLSVWDFDTGEKLFETTYDYEVDPDNLHIVQDNRYLVINRYSKLDVFDLVKNTFIGIIPNTGNGHNAFITNSQILTIGYKKLLSWELPSCEIKDYYPVSVDLENSYAIGYYSNGFVIVKEFMHYKIGKDCYINLLEFWNALDSTLICNFEYIGDTIYTFKIHNDKVIFSTSNVVIVIDLNTGGQVYSLDGHVDIIQTLHVINSIAITACKKGEIIIWDIEKGKQLFKLSNTHTLTINSVSISEDLSHLVSTSLDSTMKLWEIGKFLNFDTKNINIKTEKSYHNSPVLSINQTINLVHNQKYIISSSIEEIVSIWLFDKRPAMLLAHGVSVKYPTKSIFFDYKLATLFNKANYQRPIYPGIHHVGIISSSITRDNKSLVLGDFDGCVKIVDFTNEIDIINIITKFNTFKVSIFDWHSEPVSVVHSLIDEGVIFSGDSSGIVFQSYITKKRELRKQNQLKNLKNQINFIIYLKEPRLLIYASQQELCIYNLKNGNIEVNFFKQGSIKMIKATENDDILVCLVTRSSIKITNELEEVIYRIDHPNTQCITSVDFDENLTLIATICSDLDNSFRIIDIRKNKILATLTFDQPLMSIASDFNENHFVIGDYHGGVHFLKFNLIE